MISPAFANWQAVLIACFLSTIDKVFLKFCGSTPFSIASIAYSFFFLYHINRSMLMASVGRSPAGAHRRLLLTVTVMTALLLTFHGVAARLSVDDPHNRELHGDCTFVYEQCFHAQLRKMHCMRTRRNGTMINVYKCACMCGILPILLIVIDTSACNLF